MSRDMLHKPVAIGPLRILPKASVGTLADGDIQTTEDGAYVKINGVEYRFNIGDTPTFETVTTDGAVGITAVDTENEGGLQIKFLEVRPFGSHFPLRFYAGWSDFGDDQIDNTWSFSMNENHYSALHPVWGENVENFYVTPGGQRLIEKNWSYTSIDNTISFRPFAFNVNIDTHEAAIEWRVATNNFLTRAGSTVYFAFSDSGITANRQITGVVPSTGNSPLLSMTATDAGTAARLVYFKGDVDAGNAGLELDLRGSGAGTQANLLRLNAESYPQYVTCTSNSKLTYYTETGSADVLYVVGSNGQVASWGLDYSALKFVISGTALLGDGQDYFSIDLGAGGSRGAITAKFTEGNLTSPGIRFQQNASGFYLEASNEVICAANGLRVCNFSNSSGSPFVSVGTASYNSGTRFGVSGNMEMTNGTGDGLSFTMSSGWSRIRHFALSETDANTAIRISPGGTIYVNAPTGRVGELKINDATVFQWAAATLTSVVAHAFAGNVLPYSNDICSLGASGTAFSDLFLASGSVINFNAGDVTITHSSNAIAFAGASSGYTFDAITKVGVYTVGTLPSASSNAGFQAQVTDSSVASSGNFGATVSGGGSNRVKVFSDGTNWIIA